MRGPGTRRVEAWLSRLSGWMFNLGLTTPAEGDVITFDATNRWWRIRTLLTFLTGLTITNPTLAGTVAGTPAWTSSQAITLSTAAQPNITSVGTLTALTISGDLAVARIDLTSSGGTIFGGSSGTTIRDSADTADNLALTDAGVATFRNNLNLSAGTFQKAGVNASQIQMQTGTGGTVAASTTNYFTYGAGGGSATENARQTPVPKTVTVKNLYVVTSTAQGGGGSLVVTLRKNGVNTAVTLTIAAGAAAGTFSDTTHSVSFTAGDLLSVGFVNNDGAAVSAAITGWGLTYDI